MSRASLAVAVGMVASHALHGPAKADPVTYRNEDHRVSLIYDDARWHVMENPTKFDFGIVWWVGEGNPLGY